MKNNQTKQARVSSFTALAAAALLIATPFTTAFAQAAPPEVRWRALAGCWVPQENTTVGANSVSGAMMTCIAPVAGTQSADIATIVNKQVARTERITASGQRINKTVDKCPGWESATWSTDKNRLLLRSEFDCGDSVHVKGSGVLGMDMDGNLIQVTGSAVGTNAGAVVVRFRPADVALVEGTVLKDSAMVQTVLAETPSSLTFFRRYTGSAPTIASVLDLSKNVDEQVAQAWLSEFGKPEKLSAKDLITMADAGMPPSLIDMMVAMTYPDRFQLQARADGSTEPRPVNADINNNGRANSACYDDLDRFGYLYGSRFDNAYCGRYGYRYGRYGMLPYGYLGFGYPYGYGFGGYGYGGYGTNFYGNSPIVIVTRGSDEPARPRGRAVVGGGYTRERSSGDGGGSTPRSTGSSGTGSSSGSSTSASPTSSGSSGSSGGETRTAKPRTPPPIN